MSDDKKGMLRHVDILGRVVIPREVRKALRINYGDLMEFCACSNQQVVMRKFHLIREISDLADSLIKLARLGRSCDIYILDTEKIVCKNGDKKIPEGDINKEVIEILNNRESKELSNFALVDNEFIKNAYVFPIISGGDLIGGVIVSDAVINEDIIKVTKEIANFLSSYFSE